ncbi:MAG: hypothetical protein LBK95_14415 [Bifidobacteriaceae bacterium]|jgi:hypothetical protein|nr:hypothetical protein [Bifidobacteriaceae bacterium]
MNRHFALSVVVLTLVAGLSLPTTTATLAESTPPAPSPEPSSSGPPITDPGRERADIAWQVRPAYSEGEDPRAYFVLESDPGARLSDVMVIDNVSREAVTVAIYGQEAVLTADGKYSAPPGRAEQGSFGLWISPSVESITVEPYSTGEVPFTIEIPEAATPGDYDGAIFTSYLQPQEQDGETVMVDMRVGVRVHLRVSGDLNPALKVDSLKVERTNPWWNPLPCDVYASFRVTNVGNVRVTAKAVSDVAANYLFGKVNKTGLGDVSTPELLPGSSVVFSTGEPGPEDAWAQGPRIEGIWGFGKQTYTVYLVNGKVPNSEQTAPTAQATVTVWLIPWIPLVLLVALLVWLFRLIIRRVFRARLERRKLRKAAKRKAKREAKGKAPGKAEEKAQPNQHATATSGKSASAGSDRKPDGHPSEGNGEDADKGAQTPTTVSEGDASEPADRPGADEPGDEPAAKPEQKAPGEPGVEPADPRDHP